MESLGIGLRNQQLEPFRVVIQPESGSRDDCVSHSGEEFIHACRAKLITLSVTSPIIWSQ
jgi:hypothetical protein